MMTSKDIGTDKEFLKDSQMMSDKRQFQETYNCVSSVMGQNPQS